MLNFASLSPSVLVSQAQQVVTAMTGNATFPEPFLAPAPSLAQLSTDLNALQAAITATTARDQSRIQERNAAANGLATDLLRLARYVELVADGDSVKLQGSGFPLRVRAARRTVFAAPAAPASVELSHGALSGQMQVRASRVADAASYEVQYTAADPTVEANWAAAGTFKNGTRIQLQNLTPGKTYSVRLRGIGTAGPGSWSTAVSLMAM